MSTVSSVSRSVSAGFPLLSSAECFWRDHQIWLASRGYMLRPRYMPHWIPSWEISGKGRGRSWYDRHEDALYQVFDRVMDATRISDGKIVALRRMNKTHHPRELEILEFLSTPSVYCAPRNHCVPTYDVLHVPDDHDTVIVVTPFLRAYDSPKFETIAEIIDFFRQIFKALNFMHSLHIAHRNINSNSIMMDASSLYPDGFHPIAIDKNFSYDGPAKHYTRTQRPPKYYLIDFSLSRQYTFVSGRLLQWPVLGSDTSVPEFQGEGIYKHSNPFSTDVYCMGNLIRTDFLVGNWTHRATLGLDFMWPLVLAMVHDKPSKRPTMNEVIVRFDNIVQSLDKSILRSRVVLYSDSPLSAYFISFAHWTRRIEAILQERRRVSVLLAGWTPRRHNSETRRQLRLFSSPSSKSSY